MTRRRTQAEPQRCTCQNAPRPAHSTEFLPVVHVPQSSAECIGKLRARPYPKGSALFREVVRVDALELVGDDGCDPDAEVDHQGGEPPPVDQDDFLFDPRDVLAGLA